MAFVRLSPGEFTSVGRAAVLEQFERIELDRAGEMQPGAVVNRREGSREPAIEADLEWDERPA